MPRPKRRTSTRLDYSEMMDDDEGQLSGDEEYGRERMHRGSKRQRVDDPPILEYVTATTTSSSSSSSSMSSSSQSSSQDQQTRSPRKQLRIDGTDEDGYNFGAIRQIEVHDFMTFSHVVAKPGPHMNVIIGPNGTGKSTLVAAIALALGGSPKLLESKEGEGTKRLADFVKRTCPQAWVEVELSSGGNRNLPATRIRRQFGRDNVSKWFIDGKEVRKRLVLRVVQRYRVQVDNLCHFLPQFRVPDFSTIDGKKLLAVTLEALDKIQLAEKHNNLIALQDALTSSTHNTVELERKVEECKTNVDELKVRVQLAEAATQMRKELGLYKDLLPWMHYSAANDKLTKTRARLEEKQAELGALEEKLVPLHAETKKSEELVKQHDDKVRTAIAKEQKVKRELGKVQAARKNAQNELELRKDKLMARMKQRGDVKRTLREVEEDLAAKKAQLQEAIESNAQQDLKSKLEALEKEWTQVQADESKLNEAQRELVQQRREAISALRKAESDLQSIQTREGARKRWMMENFSLEARMKEWVEKNRSRFTGQVEGPLFDLLDLADNVKMQHVVIQALKDSKLRAFVVETAEDMQLLSKAEDALGKLSDVNVIRLSLDRLHVTPESERVDLSLYGDGVWSDTLLKNKEGSSLGVMGALSLFEFDSVPVFAQTDKVDALDLYNQSQGKVRRVFTATQLFVMKRSFYTGKVLEETTGMPAASRQTESPMFRAQDVREVDVRSLEEAVVECKRAEQSSKKQSVELSGTVAELSARKMEVQKKRKEVNDALGGLGALQSGVKRLEQRAQRLRKELAPSSEDNVLRQQLDGMRAKRMAVAAAMMEENRVHFAYVKRVSERSNAQTKLTTASEMLETLRATAASIEAQLMMPRMEVDTLTEQVEAARTQRNVTKRALRDSSLKKEGATKALLSLPEEYRTLHGMESRKQSLEAQLESEGMEDDPSVSLSRAEKELEELQRRLDVATEDREGKRTQYTVGRAQLETDLRERVARLNELLRFNFERMGHAGELVLATPEKMKDWKLDMMVSLNGRPKKMLGRTHSGGERSLCTFLYTMALQRMGDTTGFRLVDEINQGMDTTYETECFNKVVSGVVGPGNPQYFMLTPKYRSDLVMTEHMCMLCVHNGPHMVSSDIWMRTMHKKLRARAALEDDGEE